MPIEEGEHGFGPREFANAAASAGMKAMTEFLAEHDAEARHIFVVLDIDPFGLPADSPNAAVAGHGYGSAEDLFIELLSHARRVGAEVGLTVTLMTGPVGGEG